VSKRTAFVAALALGLTFLVGSSTGFAQPASTTPAAPAAPDASGHVQLNADTAVTTGLTDKYANGDLNVALGECLPAGTPAGGPSPASTTFSSPVLTFSGYTFLPTIGVAANVTANATLKPGTKAGSYPLVMNCAGKTYRATFTVTKPAPQVRKVPMGAPYTGGGGTAG
jgi:hypothetical protein